MQVKSQHLSVVASELFKGIPRGCGVTVRCFPIRDVYYNWGKTVGVLSQPPLEYSLGSTQRLTHWRTTVGYRIEPYWEADRLIN